MEYYEELRETVHKQLTILHDELHKSYGRISQELDVTSKETIRKLTNRETYLSFRPDFQTLQDLAEAMQIQVPADQYQPELPAAVQRDMNILTSYMVRFDEYQRTMVLGCCKLLDSDRQHYQKSPHHKRQMPAAADSSVSYGKRNPKPADNRNGMRPPESPSRKTD